MKLTIGLIAFLLAATSSAISSLRIDYLQANTMPVAKSGPVAKEEKAAALKEFIKDLKDNYVFPDLAAKVSEMLQGHLDRGEYDSMTDGAQFSKTVTDQLHEICQDAHLRFRYNPEVQPVRKSDEAPTPDEIKAYNHQVMVTNAGYEHVDRLNGNIGYLEIRGFPDADAAKTLAPAAFNFLANTDALILDLRRNGGGDPEAVKVLLSYLFNKSTHLNDIYFRQGNKTFQSWTNSHVPGKKYLKKDVYVLTSSRTGSGAEECAYDLQCLHRATIIGTSTWGGANPGGSYRLSDHFEAFIPSGRAINPYTKKNWEGTGVIPDVKVDADKALVEAQKMALEKLMESAADVDKDRYKQALSELESSKE